ncbi:acyltransferase [Salinibacter sp.]|uniref:acyltransferase n=1 Tax=Salinibacter sp. TaxID=2065818 RepID=UPI0021E8B110|nr:acyltransferase [Salinibacter sp.]
MSSLQDTDVFIHESAYVDEPSDIGAGTKIWHYCHVSQGVLIGANCTFGQNGYIGEDVEIGDNVKVQNNVSIYTGCKIEDDVFLGPSCVLTNVSNPRSQVDRQNLYETTHFRRGSTVGANATIVCGITLGRYCFIGAGTVVTEDVPDYALILGNPGCQQGWMSRHGHPLTDPDEDGVMVCPESGFRYQIQDDDTLRCLDLDEEKPLPEELREGRQSYQAFKEDESLNSS